MLEQASVALPCVAQFTTAGTGATGLTVTCTVYLWDGSSWASVVTSQSATEVGEGFYSYQLSSGNNTGEGLYLFVFSTAGVADLKKVGVGWAVGKAGIEDLDATISSRLASASYTAPDNTTIGTTGTAVAAIKVKTDQLVFTITNKVDASIQAAGDFAQAAADKVWATAARTLTSYGTLVADVTTAVWAAGARTLTSFGSLVADTATAVWASGTRTLTSFGALASDVWAVGSRTLTSYGTLVADSAAAVWASVARTLTSFGTLVADVSDGVWDEPRAGHVTSGTFGEGVSSVQGSVTGSVASVTGDVGGNVVGSVGSVSSGGITSASFASGAITAGAIAADAIGASELAADAVAEIQAGLATASAVATLQGDTDNIQTRLPAALVGGRMDSSVGAMAADVVTASAIAADALGAVELAGDAVAEIADAVWDEARAGHVTAGTFGQGVASVQGNITGTVASVVGSVGSVAAGGITAASIATGAVDADALAADAVAEIVDGVWDEALSGHAGAGSAGQALSAAGSAADPLLNPVPGEYPTGTAGHALGLLAVGGLTVISPFNPVTGKLTLVRGDDYSGGIIPAFRSSDWPDLTDADEVRFTVRLRPHTATGLGVGGNDPVLLTMTDTTEQRVEGTGEQSVLFEPLATDEDTPPHDQEGGTSDLPPGTNACKWDVQATLSDGTVRTLATGLMDVVEDQTRVEG